MQYLDFEIEIATVAGADPTVRVLRSPAGEASGPFRWHLDREETGRRIEALQDALLGKGVGPSGAESREPPTSVVTALGRDLWTALIGDSLLAAYEISRDRAKQQKAGLRLKLRALDPEVATLPFEYLLDDRRKAFPALSTSTPIVRYIPLQEPIEPLEVTPPLRMLGMVATPRGFPPLDAEKEMRNVEAAVEKLRSRKLIELHWVEGQRPYDLQSSLQDGDWHIFHFIGHGGFDRDRGEGIVALADDAGDAMRITGSDLGILLGIHEPLRLAVLNACDSAKSGEVDVFSSTAAALVRQGTPAVLAMQYRITDRAAVEFSRAFYAALAAGTPVDAAVAAGRVGLKLAVPGTLEWGTPVLSTRAPDGVLFRLPEPPIDKPDTDGNGPDDGDGGGRRWWAWLLAIAAIAGVIVVAAVIVLPPPPPPPSTQPMTPGPSGATGPASTGPASTGPIAPSLTGRIAYATPSGIVVMAPNGSGLEQIPGTAARNSDPAWTPDGSSIAFTSADGIRVAPVEESGPSAQVTDSAQDVNPAWAPDGTTLAFASRRGGGDYNIYLREGGTIRPLRETATEEHDPAWAPTGTRLAFASGKGADREIVTWSPDDGFEPITDNAANDVDPAWSPDGEWLAFASDRAGDFDVWLMRPDGSDARQITSGVGTDHDPTWSPDGQALAFSRSEGSGPPQLYVVDLESGEPIAMTDGDGASVPDWR